MAKTCDGWQQGEMWCILDIAKASEGWTWRLVKDGHGGMGGGHRECMVVVVVAVTGKTEAVQTIRSGPTHTNPQMDPPISM